MKKSITPIQGLVLVVSVALLGGCSTWEKVAGKKADYKQSRTEAPLEIPPDLSSATIEDALAVPGGTATTYSDYASGEQGKVAPGSTGVLVQPQNLRIERHGDKQWLVAQASAEAMWPKVRDFWLQNGFLLTMDDPSVGILETEWAENRADIPQDIIRGTIGKALDFLYSSATRDRFRVRLERVSDDTTEIFISHRGMEEVEQGSKSESTIWKPRPSDPELEAEMLKRLMVFMGSSEAHAAGQVAQAHSTARAPRSQLLVDASGASTLVVEEGISRAWREVGLALDRVGFTVEDRDRTAGLYFVRYNDPLKEDKKKGFLSKLAFWSSDDPLSAEQYQILLTGAGEKTNVTVQNKDGQRDNSSTAKRILTLVQEQMQ